MEIAIVHDEQRWRVQLYAFERGQGNRTFYFYLDGKLTGIDLADNTMADDKIKPLLELPRDMFLDLQKAMVDDFRKIFGDKEVQAKYEGELKAKEEHIKDLRLSSKELVAINKLLIKMGMMTMPDEMQVVPNEKG